MGHHRFMGHLMGYQQDPIKIESHQGQRWDFASTDDAKGKFASSQDFLGGYKSNWGGQLRSGNNCRGIRFLNNYEDQKLNLIGRRSN